MCFFLKQKYVVVNLGAGGNKMIEFSTLYEYIKSLNVLMITIPSCPVTRLKPKAFPAVLETDFTYVMNANKLVCLSFFIKPLISK